MKLNVWQSVISVLSITSVSLIFNEQLAQAQPQQFSYESIEINTINTAQTTPRESEPIVQDSPVQPGRATRSGPSYIGIGGNIGFTGDTEIGEGAFNVIGKIGLTRNFSVRPSAVINDNVVFIIPLTIDFPSENFPETNFSVAPYLGGGLAVSTGSDTNLGGAITAGLDIPLSDDFSGNAAVNIGFIDETDVGLSLGVGYNF
jgi:hypothetical protein